MSNCIVFYEDWQMECCGTAFSTGDRVKWSVYQCNQLNSPVNVGKVDYCYEAHDSDWTKLSILEGKVRCIKILYQKYIPSEEDPKLLDPVDGILKESEIAKGFDEPYDGMDACGYIVEIENYSVRPAQREEITFQ